MGNELLNDELGMDDAARTKDAYNSSNLEGTGKGATMTITRDAAAGTNDTGNSASTGLGNVTVTLTITLSADRLKTFVDEVIAAAKEMDPTPPSPIGGSGPINVPPDPSIDVDFAVDWAPPGNSGSGSGP